ncbi:MAG TPA: hypothetical protein VGB45_12775 [Abditibacterium sp.]
MEMVYGGIASMLLGWWAGRALKLSDVGTIIVITMAGAGSLLTGLAYLWIADITIGQDGSLIWFIVGAIGGAAGIVTFLLTRYADWFVDLCKRNGLL